MLAVRNAQRSRPSSRPTELQESPADRSPDLISANVRFWLALIAAAVTPHCMDTDLRPPNLIPKHRLHSGQGYLLLILPHQDRIMDRGHVDALTGRQKENQYPQV